MCLNERLNECVSVYLYLQVHCCYIRAVAAAAQSSITSLDSVRNCLRSHVATGEINTKLQFDLFRQSQLRQNTLRPQSRNTHTPSKFEAYMKTAAHSGNVVFYSALLLSTKRKRRKFYATLSLQLWQIFKWTPLFSSTFFRRLSRKSVMPCPQSRILIILSKVQSHITDYTRNEILTLYLSWNCPVHTIQA